MKLVKKEKEQVPRLIVRSVMLPERMVEVVGRAVFQVRVVFVLGRLEQVHCVGLVRMRVEEVRLEVLVVMFRYLLLILRVIV